MFDTEDYLQRIEALEADVALLRTTVEALELQAERQISPQEIKQSKPVQIEMLATDTEDELLPAAIDVVLEVGQASVSILQRRLKLGYGRAARLVDQMEEKGVIGPFEDARSRKILITKQQWLKMK